MANYNTFAMAIIAIALASSQNVNAEMMKAIAKDNGIDNGTAADMAEEMMRAKMAAEADMAEFMF